MTLREGYLKAQRLQTLFSCSRIIDPIRVAKVLDTSQATLFKTILLDKGQPAVSGRGSPSSPESDWWGASSRFPNVSKALLITDEKSNVDALIQRTRAEGILQGDGSGGGRLKYVSNLEDVQAGDFLLTSGLAGLYPKGLILGSVTAFDKKADSLFQKIEVIPASDFSRLEEVLILAYKQKK